MLTQTLRNNWIAFAVLGSVLLLGALLRFQDLATKTIAHIEIYVPGIELPYGLSDPGPRMGLRETLIGVMVDGEPHPPGYYLLMLAWTKLFGTGALALRLPSVLFGIASILLIGWLGLLERDKWTGILAAGMLALNGHQVFWSQIAKMYSMGCFLGLASTVLLVLAFRQRSWNRLLQFGYLLVTLAGLATVVYFWLLFMTQMLWILVHALAKEKAVPGLLRLQFLIAVLASPFLSLAYFQSQRQSYLSPNPLPDLMDYVQFGFLFEPDPFAIPPQSWPNLIIILLFLLAVGLLFWGWRTWPRADETVSASAVGLPWAVMLLSGLFASAAILRLAQFTRGMDASRTVGVAMSSIVPLVLVAMDGLLRRYWSRVGRPPLSSVAQGVLAHLPDSPSVLLAFLPVAILVVIAPIMPLFASRTALLFTPYLLIVLAWSLRSLVKQRRAWAILVPVLLVAFWSSVYYYKDSYIEHPNDYKGLSQQWIPQVEPSDLIFVRRHWVTTAIFYYMKASKYHFVGALYAEQLSHNPQARVWVLDIDGLPLSQEIVQALQGFSSDRSRTIDAMGIHVRLYTRDGPVSVGTSTGTGNSGQPPN